ncbi:MAG TPA: RecX family transcriptional regulator [Bacilli bacterium]|nr:RecX family transcriptional regulator [Bacilli bacterium]
MEISRIKKLNSGKYQIELSDKTKIITYDEVILKYNLLYKKEIDSKDINEINNMNDYYSIYSNLVKYLTKKVHSKKEYYKYIEKYNLNDLEKERLTKELEEIKLLDDNRFIKAYVSDKFYLSNEGPYKIKKELLEHNINEDLINEELSKISYEDILNKVDKLVNKKLKTLKGSSYIIKQKIYQDMNTLGYDKSIVDECLNEEIDDSINLEKDFNKFFNEYSRKEEDTNKLYFKIKQKMFSKGYSLSKIDEFIENKKNS